MLSSPRWTYPDTLMAVAVVAMASRVFGDGAEAKTHYQAEAGAPTALAEVLTHSLPDPEIWLALNTPYRVDGALRCIGLAEIEMRRECRRSRHQGCRRAETRLADLRVSLWPTGRTGQPAGVLRERVSTYASAYAALSKLEAEGEIASSELIRERDGAICRQYRINTEARLHGQQTRQSG